MKHQSSIVRGFLGAFLFVQTALLAPAAESPAVTNALAPANPPVRDAAGTAAPGAHLDYAPGRPPKFWSVAAAETVMARWPDFSKAYFNGWTYVNGYELFGFEMLYRETGDQKYFDYIKNYIDQFVDADGNFRDVANAKGQTNTVVFNNLDNMMTGNSLVMLYETTRDERYKKAADTIRRAFDTYPTNSDGGFWHNKRMNGQMWIDGIFMGQMFLTRYGKSIGDSQYCWDTATKQLSVFAHLAERDHSGLYLHGYFEPGHGEMEDIFRRLAAGLKRTQDAKSGRWFQVVDKGDLPDNWTDNSGSSMFTYTLARGIELGLLDKTEYEPVVEKGYQGIIANAKINDRGLLDIYSACDGVGVQVDYAHYINFKKSINAKEGNAGFLWATAIVEKPQLEQLKKK
jgi:unsaturated rhamnogalacturonyl hydrolase